MKEKGASSPVPTQRARHGAGRDSQAEASAHVTRVALTWIEKRIEHWIRFGHDVEQTMSVSPKAWTGADK